MPGKNGNPAIPEGVARTVDNPAHFPRSPSSPIQKMSENRNAPCRQSNPGVESCRLANLVVEPPLFSAPMAGYTNYAYREILRRFGGVGLIATEMVSARSFAYLDDRGDDHPQRLWGVRDEPRPISVQIWDNDPAILARLAATLAHDYRVDVVDLNFGCPAKQIAGRSASGSA
ncbi:MAG TPA: hypothetical protein DEB39_17040, partial [Planctomycetaceae bacterium]|nr:hypothetical protein [Planctomycetaceae bacterium]